MEASVSAAAESRAAWVVEIAEQGAGGDRTPIAGDDRRQISVGVWGARVSGRMRVRVAVAEDRR